MFPPPSKRTPKKRRLPFERSLLLSVVATGIPCGLLAFLLLWTNAYSLDHKIEGTVLLTLLWLGLALSVRNQVIGSIRVLSNVIASLEEDDFSFRAPGAVSGDALGDLAIEINNLARALEAEHLGTMEAESLLQKVISETDGVILAFSLDGKLKLFNRAATTFLGKSKDDLSNQTAQGLGIADLLEGPPSDTITRLAQGIEKRWLVRRTQFRQSGVPHRLVMLSEASEALRKEERMAWQRMVRVLSHEINNSLAPIRSVAHTLARIVSNTDLPERVRKDFDLGLDVIGSRAEGLTRFLQSYTKLSRLPMPDRRPVRIEGLVERISSLEGRLRVQQASGPNVCIDVDPNQLEQVLINIVRNAVESVLAKYSEGNFPPDGTNPLVMITWTVAGKDLELRIRDRGTGLLDASNLFVPFYTTKETGTGIGLVLSRQIIENHGGRLMIRNRADIEGCDVEIKIPGCVLSGTDQETA
jgi:two-component system, NtrC family, nitrogen regulation sensor histidine kinase NtrY